MGRGNKQKVLKLWKGRRKQPGRALCAQKNNYPLGQSYSRLTGRVKVGWRMLQAVKRVVTFQKHERCCRAWPGLRRRLPACAVGTLSLLPVQPLARVKRGGGQRCGWAGVRVGVPGGSQGLALQPGGHCTGNGGSGFQAERSGLGAVGTRRVLGCWLPCAVFWSVKRELESKLDF